MNLNIKIREMIESDIVNLNREFNLQGWEKPISLFKKYYDEQNSGNRRVFIASSDDIVLGYVTLISNDKNGPFANKNIPTVVDFNVLEKHQNNGVGNLLLDRVEEVVRRYSDKICLGVGLHSGYGPAQRMYVKRGYVPDGSGVWYKNEVVKPYSKCINNDELVLYLSKIFKKN